jgi:hypothetical protein
VGWGEGRTATVSTVLTNPSGAGGHASHHFHPLPPPSSHSSVRSLDDSLVRPRCADRRQQWRRGNDETTPTMTSPSLRRSDIPCRRRHRCQVRSLSMTIKTGAGEGGGIAVLLPPPSTDTRAGNVGVEYVSFFNCYASNIFIYFFTIHIHRHPRQHPLRLHSPQKCL